jgi:subtilase-type serine protease
MKKIIVILGVLAVAEANQGWAAPAPAAFDVLPNQTLTKAQILGVGGTTGVVESGGSFILPVGNSSVAITLTGSATITNSGTIEQLGTGRAIRDNTGGLTVTVTNNAGATILATDGDVIQMNQPNSNIVFNNYGLLNSLNVSNGGSQAIDFNAITTGSNVLHNFATGVILANEADSVRPGVNGFVYNDGIIKSTNNPGSTSSSDGVDLQANSGVTVVNATTGTAQAPGTGLIEGARHGITGGNTDVTTDGTFVLNVTNNQGGTIRGDNGSGINIDGFNAKELVTIVNNGTIIGNGVAGDGDGVDVDGMVNLVNTGTIKSVQAFNDASEGVTVGGGTIINSGTIEGDNVNGGIGRGMTLAGLDKDPTTDAAIPTEGIFGDTTVTNSGLIRGQTDSGIAVTGAATAHTLTITNLAGGTIEGGGATAAAIFTGAQNSTVINYGTITADASGRAVDFGSGNSNLQILGGSAVINGDISGGTGTSSLTINPGSGNSFNYGGAISNFSSVEIGGGTVTLGGTSTYTGATTVDAGVLAVNGSIASSAVQVNNGATLAGTGTVGNTTIASGGTISPAGNGAIGTLSVNGNITFASGSNYTVNAAPNGSADLIHASGSATLNGGSVVALTADGSWNPTTVYKIVSADQGVHGSFGNVASNFAFLNPTLGYSANAVSLTLKRNDVRFASLGATRNEVATANALDRLDAVNAAGVTSSPIYNAVVQLSTTAARSAFDQLSGESYASVKTALIGDSQFLSDAALSRLRSAFDASAGSSGPAVAFASNGAVQWTPPNTGHNAVWAQGFGGWGSSKSDGDAASVNHTTGGVFFGADTLVPGNWRVGVLGGYSYTTFNDHSQSSTAQSNNLSLGLYGGNQWGALKFSTGAAYTFHDINARRSVAFTGFDDSLRSGYNAGTSQIFGELGYSINAGRVALEPFVNLAYVNLHTDAFSEDGGAAALNGRAGNTNTPFSTLGLHASTGFVIGQTDATARGTLGWRHAYGTVNPTSTQSFAGGDSFSVEGVPIGRDAAVIEAGLDFNASKNLTLGVSYSGQIGNGTQDNSAQAKLTYKF